jgi:hypothetical protein
MTIPNGVPVLNENGVVWIGPCRTLAVIGGVCHMYDVSYKLPDGSIKAMEVVVKPNR